MILIIKTEVDPISTPWQILSHEYNIFFLCPNVIYLINVCIWKLYEYVYHQAGYNSNSPVYFGRQFIYTENKY